MSTVVKIGDNEFTFKKVQYKDLINRMDRIVDFTTKAFIKNHAITEQAYQATDPRFKHTFMFQLAESTADNMEEVDRQDGHFFIAEDADKKIMGIAVGRDYGKAAMSPGYIENVFKSQCCFKNVMQGWWGLMAKFEAKEGDYPPGKIYHQAVVAVDPEYAGQGIGRKFGGFIYNQVKDLGYDALAIETSSESADQAIEKVGKTIALDQVFDESSGGKITARLKIINPEKGDAIKQWFFNKLPKELDLELKTETTETIQTSHGDIAIWDKGEKDKPAIVFLHGNSSCKEAFTQQMRSKELENYRLIAIDLPGHGKSTQSEAAYPVDATAQIIKEVIEHLDLHDVTLVGWSFGGHLALHVGSEFDRVKQIVITGTPPLTTDPACLQEAFIPSAAMPLISQERKFNEEEAKLFNAVGGTNHPFFHAAAVATDGKFRKKMTESMMDPERPNEVDIISNCAKPIAVIGGVNDKGINYEYVKGLPFKNLWKGKVHLIKDAGHAVLLEKPQAFNELLTQMLAGDKA